LKIRRNSRAGQNGTGISSRCVEVQSGEEKVVVKAQNAFSLTAAASMPIAAPAAMSAGSACHRVGAAAPITPAAPRSNPDGGHNYGAPSPMPIPMSRWARRSNRVTCSVSSRR
jgi:hypothetical protein